MKKKKKAACIWSSQEAGGDRWSTSCGHEYIINDGTPAENHMKFCLYCGKPLRRGA